MVRIQVQGYFDYPTPAASQSCRPTREQFFVIAEATGAFPSVSPLHLRIPLAQFDTNEEAQACAKQIRAAIAAGETPYLYK